jgi:hypothetical protein
MANPFYIEPANPLQMLMTGVQGYDRGAKSVADQEMKAGRMEAMQTLQAGGDLRSPLAKLLSIGDTKGAAVIADFAKNNAEGQGVFGTPIYGTNQDGSPGIGTFNKQGQFKPIDTGGFKVAPGVKTIDTPQGTYVIGAKDGAPVGGGPVGGAQGQPQTGQPQQPQVQQRPNFYPNDNRGKARDTKLGTEDADKQSSIGQSKAKLDTSVANLDRLAFEADRIMKDPALDRITGIYGHLPSWPGGAAATLESKLDTLKSQVSFGVLQAMRDASKTGGALGAIAVEELKMLQNNLAALDNLKQNPKAFREEMKRIVEWSEGSKGRLQQAYDTDYGSIQKQPQQGAPKGRATKTIGGKSYYQEGNQWFEE